MLKIYIKANNFNGIDEIKELLPQAGILIQDRESDAAGILYAEAKVESSLPSLNLLNFSYPIRFLDLLSHIENLPYSQVIVFSHFSLDLRDKILINLNTNETQRVTEKESQLLHFFYQNKGVEISKDTLLQEIWAYHPDAETHTLETHIYRLRQKLEEDPNVPQVLLNCKDGYFIQ
jgi:DNA-binding response OmpR family regulator